MNNISFLSRRVKWAAAITLGLVLFVIFLLATPPGHALAQNVLQFFWRNEESTLPLPTIDASLQSQPVEVAATPLPETPVATEPQPGCGTVQVPRCDLLSVQPKVDFPIQMPGSLPDGMTFTGATDIPGGVLLRFEGAGSGILILSEIQGEPPAGQTWAVGKESVVEMVTVGNQPAEYVQGGWYDLAPAGEGGLSWNQDIPTRTLRWQAGGIQYTLVHFPEQGVHGPVGLDLHGLQALAESLSAPAENITPGAESGGLTLPQAEEKAGFDFAEPAWIPAGFTLSKIMYGGQYNAICQYYHYQPGGVSALSLVIAQSNWAMPQVSELQVKAYYDGKPIEIGISQQYLPVTGASGEQGLFVETGLRPHNLCGGEEISAHRALLWQQDGRAHVIFATLDANDGRGFVTVKEMRRMAETINGVQPAAELTSGLDPERLLSLKDAETLAGLDLQLPALMLSNVRFDHLTVRSKNGPMSAYYAGPPVGDGRTYHVMIFQTPHSQMTLEELAMAGGYTPVTVKGSPGVYQAQCWDSTTLAGGRECRQKLTWFEGETQFDLLTYFPALVPQQTVLDIAESMR